MELKGARELELEGLREIISIEYVKHIYGKKLEIQYLNIGSVGRESYRIKNRTH